MKITLDLDPTALSAEVSEFIKSLTDEDKRTMVKQVVEQYYGDFRKFEDSEFETKEKEILLRVKNGLSGYELDRYKTDDDLRTHYRYQEEKRKFRTMSHTTREEISNSIRMQLAKNIEEFIKNDEGYKTMMQEAMQAVKERFPIMVQTAMIAHFTAQLPNLQNQMFEVMNQMNNRLNDVEQKLLR